MGGLTALVLMRAKETKNRLILITKQPLVKIILLVSFSLIFWWGLYAVFYRGIKFVSNFPFATEDIIPAMFYLFFFSLMLMLIISNAIISYISLFRSNETTFLLSMPIKVEDIFLYKFFDSLVFSSWAVIFLATPLVAGYGSFYKLGWQFYLISVVFFLFFILLPTICGSFLSLLLATFLPKSKKGLFILLISAAIGLLLVFLCIIAISVPFQVEYRFIGEMIEKVGFTRNPIFPSYWIAKGILSLSHNDYKRTFLFFLLMLSNILFWGTIIYILSAKLMIKALASHKLVRKTKRYLKEGIVYKLLRSVSGDNKIKEIIVKDAKSFFRDPAQWIQFSIFFGLLGLYFLNLRTFSYDGKQMSWKMIISEMNIFATVLTLATFTSRFVFPQLSLEGRRFWIIGMAPLERKKIILGKLRFSILLTAIIGETLICISDYMLKIPLTLMFLHIVVLLGVSFGLSGLSIGLGTIYPNFHEDNPSKIVSGFGGTLNLVLSLSFVFLLLAIQFIPCYYHFVRGLLGEDTFLGHIFLSIVAILITSTITCTIPVLLGIRALKRMEIYT